MFLALSFDVRFGLKHISAYNAEPPSATKAADNLAASKEQAQGVDTNASKQTQAHQEQSEKKQPQHQKPNPPTADGSRDPEYMYDILDELLTPTEVAEILTHREVYSQAEVDQALRHQNIRDIEEAAALRRY